MQKETPERYVTFTKPTTSQIHTLYADINRKSIKIETITDPNSSKQTREAYESVIEFYAGDEFGKDTCRALLNEIKSITNRNLIATVGLTNIKKIIRRERAMPSLPASP